MQYKISESGDAATVSLDGQLNFSCNEEFRNLLSSLQAIKLKNVIFNLSNLSGIDSVGLGLLYIAQEDLAESGMKLSLASPRNSVARLLELTDAAKMFSIID